MTFAHEEDKVLLEFEGKTRNLLPKSWTWRSKSEHHFVFEGLWTHFLFPKQSISRDTTSYKILEFVLRCVMINFFRIVYFAKYPLVVAKSHRLLKFQEFLYAFAKLSKATNTKTSLSNNFTTFFVSALELIFAVACEWWKYNIKVC